MIIVATVTGGTAVGQTFLTFRGMTRRRHTAQPKQLKPLTDVLNSNNILTQQHSCCPWCTGSRISQRWLIRLGSGKSGVAGQHVELSCQVPLAIPMQSLWYCWVHNPAGGASLRRAITIMEYSWSATVWYMPCGLCRLQSRAFICLWF